MATENTRLQQRTEAVESVLTSGDAALIGDLYTRDGMLMPPGSDFVTGRNAIAEFWQGVSESGVEAIAIETLDLETTEGMASRVGTAVLNGTDGETIDEVKFVELWRRDDGEWRIHRDIWNSNIAE